MALRPTVPSSPAAARSATIEISRGSRAHDRLLAKGRDAANSAMSSAMPSAISSADRRADTGRAAAADTDASRGAHAKSAAILMGMVAGT